MQDELTRRRFLRVAAAGAALVHLNCDTSASLAEPKLRLPPGLPPGVRSVLAASLNGDPASLNTDWFGSVLLHALLLWSKRGISQVKPFARAWLGHHLNTETVSKFSGPRSRAVTAGGIPITTYAGHYGLAFPCYEMARQFGDDRARQVCVAIGKTILHQASRNRFGLAAHDDAARFAIPDTCYFAAPPLMMASLLDRRNRLAFREQSLYQLRNYIEVFLAADKGLSKTILLEEGLGKTCWTRASGWLLWALTGVLRHLPASDPAFLGLCKSLNQLAEGIARVQHPSGGFHVLLDEPDTPLETTGAAMFATGLHESVRRGWLPNSFAAPAGRAWEFVRSNITPDGEIRQAYTGWALPAEERIMSMDEHRMEWIPGMILLAANEMATPL